jgi:hypothetical protein
MMRAILLVLSGCGIVATGGAIVAAPQFERPGPTQAHVWVENRGENQAIPVTFVYGETSRKPLPVAISGVPTVALPSTAVVQTRRVRQPWEYRVVTLSGGQDMGAVLSGLGNDGWEAISIPSPVQAGSLIILKRPRQN